MAKSFAERLSICFCLCIHINALHSPHSTNSLRIVLVPSMELNGIDMHGSCVSSKLYEWYLVCTYRTCMIYIFTCDNIHELFMIHMMLRIYITMQ